MQMHASNMHSHTLPFSHTHPHIEIEYRQAIFLNCMYITIAKVHCTIFLTAFKKCQMLKLQSIRCLTVCVECIMLLILSTEKVVGAGHLILCDLVFVLTF